MSDYDVGYGKPPREHQFKAGNKAAKGRKSPKKQALAMPEILEKALRTKRKIKRGGEVVELAAAEILAERLVQTMLTGSAREMGMIMGMIERFAPQFLATAQEALDVHYHRAEGSNVPLPSADLWKGGGR